MRGFFKTKQKYFRGASATFELGAMSSAVKERVAYSMSSDELGPGLNELEWACLLTKRATIQAIKHYPNIDPIMVSVRLLEINFEAKAKC